MTKTMNFAAVVAAATAAAVVATAAVVVAAAIAAFCYWLSPHVRRDWNSARGCPDMRRCEKETRQAR